MQLQTESVTTPDDDIATMTKLRISGTDEELRRLAFLLMDAISDGKAKHKLEGGAKIIVKRVESLDL
jgi:hypothetical protein